MDQLTSVFSKYLPPKLTAHSLNKNSANLGAGFKDVFKNFPHILGEMIRIWAIWQSNGGETTNYMGVSKNRGTPKWMVYNGKPY